jgi:hypothetical protein
MTPEQAVRLLSVEEWPPRLEHWPPKDKQTWRKGMTLVGLIEAVMTLPRPDGSKKRGEPYLAMYVRREGDQHLVMWHGWHTASEDVPPMQPRPGLLFAAVYRGERDNGFEDFKFLVTPYDPPGERQQTRTDAGQAQPPAARAPEGGDTPTSPPSGSTTPAVPESAIRTVRIARSIVKGKPADWQELFRRLSAEARDAGELDGKSELDGFKLLIGRTEKRVAALVSA